MSPFLHDQAPIGPRCCLAHSGLREEDESGGCDFRSRCANTDTHQVGE